MTELSPFLLGQKSYEREVRIFPGIAVAYLHKAGFCLFSTLFHGTSSRDIRPVNSSVTDLQHTSLCTFSLIELLAVKGYFFHMDKEILLSVCS